MKRVSSPALSGLLCLSLVLMPAFFALAQSGEEVTAALQEARGAGVSESVLNGVLALGYRHQVETRAMAEFIAVIRAAREKGLPAEPLVNKMEEGFAKGIEVQLIQRAVKGELGRLAFAADLAARSTGRRDRPPEEIQGRDLVRMAETLSMGISEDEMAAIFQGAPREAGLAERVNSLEFMAALKQSGLDPKAARDVVFKGLEKGHFSKTPWKLARTVRSAKDKNVPDQIIKSMAMEVVAGNKTIGEARTALGLQSRDFTRGPQVMSPNVEPAARDSKTGGDRAAPGSSDHGAGGDASGGHGGGSDGGHGGGGSGGGSSGR